LKIENREFNGKKLEVGGGEFKKILFVWHKLKIETKMREEKYLHFRSS
jgi:predicted nucleic-acid-binding Zn-ribbon protein